MAKVNHMLKQQLKMNNHRSRHIHNLKQALQGRLKLNPLRSTIRDIKLKIKKTAKVRNSQVAHTSSLSINIKSYCMYTRDVR